MLDITASSANGAQVAFTGPEPESLPTGCLTSGVTPASSIQTNPDGSVSLHCNMGTFTSAVAPLQVTVTPNNNSLNDSTFHLTARCARGGRRRRAIRYRREPGCTITGVPSWDVSKRDWSTTASPTTATINGQQQVGYVISDLIVIAPTASKGETGLVSPSPSRTA
ncbi:hypothetical protein ACRAWC_22860 [Leifsonia sp. L25]|uniref:hypothetical protein n=1 Tax=Leifsonia sp. L25 TaxID=3423957 RepID=UPI003D6904AF